MNSLEDAEESGRPSTSKTDENVDRVKEFVLENRRISVHEASKCWKVPLAQFVAFRKGV
jgi:hypothetical protein